MTEDGRLLGAGTPLRSGRQGGEPGKSRRDRPLRQRGCPFVRSTPVSCCFIRLCIRVATLPVPSIPSAAVILLRLVDARELPGATAHGSCVGPEFLELDGFRLAAGYQFSGLAGRVVQ